MTEVLFYHLERASAQDVLPVLLLKTLERGWRAVVQVGREDHAGGPVDDAVVLAR
jgi:DNA polymerase-3 subunit chi